ncbi:MAG: hypothetical protein Q4E17_05165 [Synergistes sp.]|nr:hypothetical protein [Synergistes sp.]
MFIISWLLGGLLSKAISVAAGIALVAGAVAIARFVWLHKSDIMGKIRGYKNIDEHNKKILAFIIKRMLENGESEFISGLYDKKENKIIEGTQYEYEHLDDELKKMKNKLHLVR